MKRCRVVFIVLAALLAATVVYAGGSFLRSGVKTADTAITPTGGEFIGFIITPDGTNDVTLTFYDNASGASGTQMLPAMTFAGDGGTQSWTAPDSTGFRYYNGIYADITLGAGTVEYEVFFRPGG